MYLVLRFGTQDMDKMNDPCLGKLFLAMQYGSYRPSFLVLEHTSKLTSLALWSASVRLMLVLAPSLVLQQSIKVCIIVIA